MPDLSAHPVGRRVGCSHTAYGISGMVSPLSMRLSKFALPDVWYYGASGCAQHSSSQPEIFLKELLWLG